MRRELALLDTSWSELLREARREVACDALRRSELGVAELAHKLGFSDASAFTRAFKHWTGQTPTSFAQAWSARGARPQ